MPAQVLTTSGIWMDSYDLSGQLRGVSLEHGVELADATTFGNTTRIHFPTTKRTRAQVEGLWSAAGAAGTGGAVAGGPDRPLFDNIALEGTIFSFAPVSTEGQPAYTFQAAQATYTFGGQFGGLLPFSASAEASTAPSLVRGTLLAKRTGLTSSGTTTKYQVGAVTSGKVMYAALHVTSVSGTSPTLDVIVQSDPDSSAGGEANQITFSQANATANRAQWSTTGVTTDTWWRTSYTIGGSATPTFAFVVVVGIL